jgi:hypothetical protein
MHYDKKNTRRKIACDCRKFNISMFNWLANGKINESVQCSETRRFVLSAFSLLPSKLFSRFYISEAIAMNIIVCFRQTKIIHAFPNVYMIVRPCSMRCGPFLEVSGVGFQSISSFPNFYFLFLY